MSEQIKPNYTNIVEPKQFILYSIGSLGLFDMIRAYRNRKHFQKIEGSDIIPFWRALFNGLRAVSLFKDIQSYSSKEGYQKSFSATSLGILYFLLSSANMSSSGFGKTDLILDVISIIMPIISTIIILTPLKAANHYYQQIERNTIERPMQRRHYLLIILYVVFWGLAIWGIVEMIINPETITQS